MTLEEFSDLWSRLSATFGALPTRLAFLAALLVPRLTRLMQSVDTLRASPTFQGLIKRLPRIKPLLVPDRYCNPDILAATGTVPHRLTVGRSGRIGLVNYLRMAIVRPSSPKRAFILPSPPRIERAGSWDLPALKGAGGFRLTLHVGVWDHVDHLVASLRRSDNLRSVNTVYYCSPKAYLSQRDTVQEFTIKGRHVTKARDCAEAVVAFSADPLHSRRDHRRRIPRDQTDDRGLWLLVRESNSDAPEHRCSTAQNASTDSPLEPALGPPHEERGRPAQRQGDPWNTVRWARFIVIAGLLLLTVAAYWGWERVDRSSEALLVLGAAFVGVCLSALVQLVTRHAYGYLVERWRGAWTATTTRCIADGIKSRNGLRTSLPRNLRAYVHPDEGDRWRGPLRLPRIFPKLRRRRTSSSRVKSADPRHQARR